MISTEIRYSIRSHGAEPNTEDGHPKPGSFTPSDDTTAGAPTLAVVEAGSVSGTGEAPLVGPDAAEDAATLDGTSLIGDGDAVGVCMVGGKVEDPLRLGPAGPGGTGPDSPALSTAQTVATIPIPTIALAIQIARADGFRKPVG